MRRATSRSWGEVVPRRLGEWEEVGARVDLLRPRLGRNRFGRRAADWLRLPPYRAHLDEVGAFVWRRCDGTVTVRRMAELMRTAFGDRVEPVEPRLVTFLRQLHRGGYIELAQAGTGAQPD